MAIGERIRFFRNLKGMTQKYLGMQVGFPEKTADIRMAQYESGSRTPKADLTNNLANVFGVSTSALMPVILSVIYFFIKSPIYFFISQLRLLPVVNGTKSMCKCGVASSKCI